MKLNPFPWDLFKSGPPFNFMGTTFSDHFDVNAVNV